MSDSTAPAPASTPATSTAPVVASTAASKGATTTSIDAASPKSSTAASEEKNASATAETDANEAANASTTDATASNTNAGQQDDSALTLRALVSSKEAGVIIGRGGATIATLRTESNVKAGVSKVVPGVADRILSVGGSIDGVSKAYSLVAQTILESPAPTSADSSTPVAPAATTTTIRLLISHLLIGSVIGKGGIKIRQIQDNSGARMVASKEMLPQSTERVVEVSGSAEAIRLAIAEIAKCLIDDWDRSQGTVLYHPGAEGLGATGGSIMGNGYPTGAPVVGGGAPYGGRRVSGGGFTPGGQRRTSGGGPNAGDYGQQHQGSNRRISGGGPPPPPNPAENDPNYREQKISIPSDMVGCIIGRGGTKINEIRRLSGCRISIAKTAHDDTGERLFVISGLPENNEKALFLLYSQLEQEKARRQQQGAIEEDPTAQEA